MENKSKLNTVLLIIIIILLVICFGYTLLNNSKEKESDLFQNNQNKTITPIENKNIDNRKIVDVYAEKDIGGEILVGAFGEQMRIVAVSSIPAEITYTIKYKSAAVVPNPVIKENTYTKTVSIKEGRTVLQVLNAIDGKIDVEYTYTK